MAAGDLALNIIIGARNNAGGVIAGLGMSLAQLASGNLLGAVSIAGAAAAAAVIGFGVAAVKASGDYQQAMLKVTSQTGITAKDMQTINAAILQMGPAVGQGPTELMKALYPIASDGYKAADAINILRLSTIAAKIGMTDTNRVAYALTSALRAMGFEGKDAGRVMDVMMQTINQGKLEWSAYATQVGRLSTAARTAGISFTEANAALSTLTQSGSDASKSTTFLINLFNQMELKTDTVAKHAAKFGIPFDEAKFKAMSLAQQIDYIQKITGGSASKVMELLGNNAVAVRGFELLSKHASTFHSILGSLNNEWQHGGALMQAWNTTQQGFNVQLDKAKAAFQVLLITVGNQLLPYLSKLLITLAPLIAAFAQWMVQSNAVGKSITWVGGAINAVAGFINSLRPILAQIAAFLTSTFKPVWDQLVDTFNNQLKPAWNDFVKALQPALPALKLIGEVIGGIIVVALILFIEVLAKTLTASITVFGWIVRGVSLLAQSFFHFLADVTTVVNAVIGVFKWLYDQIVGHSIIHDLINGIIKWFQSLPGKLISILQSGFQNLTSGAVQWGKNLIQGFVDGINSMIGSVEHTASNIANTVKNFLGFHSPSKKGPGSDANKWAPALVEMFAAGLIDGTPKVEAAVQQLAALLAQLGSHPGRAGRTEIANLVNSILPQLSSQDIAKVQSAVTSTHHHHAVSTHHHHAASLHHHHAASTHHHHAASTHHHRGTSTHYWTGAPPTISSSSTSTCPTLPTQTIYILLDSRVIGQAVNNYQVRELHIQTGLRSR